LWWFVQRYWHSVLKCFTFWRKKTFLPNVVFTTTFVFYKNAYLSGDAMPLQPLKGNQRLISLDFFKFKCFQTELSKMSKISITTVFFFNVLGLLTLGQFLVHRGPSIWGLKKVLNLPLQNQNKNNIFSGFDFEAAFEWNKFYYSQPFLGLFLGGLHHPPWSLLHHPVRKIKTNWCSFLKHNKESTCRGRLFYANFEASFEFPAKSKQIPGGRLWGQLWISRQYF
jgi:hypothetical protein